jgi:hypothetical protein
MADNQRDNQQNRRGGNNYGDRNRAYSRYEEEGYIQDVGREHYDQQGARGTLITGASSSNFGRTMGGDTSNMSREFRNRDRGMGGMQGPHRGKGPKGYQRSQDRIREDVCERLTDDAMIDASHMDVRVENNEVILSGTVHNREEKRRAEDLAESVAGVRNVENRLRVERSSEQDTNNYREYDESGRLRRGS